jgi:hypothetical protein
MLNFVSLAPLNVLGSTASRFVSWFGSPMLGRAMLAAGAMLAAAAALASGDGDGTTDGSTDGATDGATEAATDGTATLGTAVAEPPQAATKTARAADAASGANR